MSEPYAMVRGSALRLTDLTTEGDITSPVRYGVSRSVVRVEVNEITDSSSGETIRSDTGERRLKFESDEETLAYTADVDFIRVQPELLHMMTAAPLVSDALGDIVGFDAQTRLPASAFAMEVWSKLNESACVKPQPAVGFGEGAFGLGPFGGSPGMSTKRRWGYTLFPYLMGGYLTGFAFDGGLVSFNVRGARTHKGARWNTGPYDFDGDQKRLVPAVSGNTPWRTIVTDLAPPESAAGLTSFVDVIHGGNAAYTSPDILAGGNASGTTPWIVHGGRAKA